MKEIVLESEMLVRALDTLSDEGLVQLSNLIRYEPEKIRRALKELKEFFS